MSVIETSDLGKIYDGGTEALKGLSMSVGQGEIFGLLGPNGAGKTTTVRLLNGTLRPTSGSSSVLGLPSGSDDIRAATATMTESAQLYEHMTVADNLRFFADLYGVASNTAEVRIDELLALLELADRKETRLGSLSTGLRKRAQLARVLLHRPRLLFLDEPTSGLDPESARQVVGLIQTLAGQEGATVLLCTHNLPLAESICTSYGFLVSGSLVWSGTREELTRATTPTRRVRITTDRGSEDHVIQDDSQINATIRSVMDSGAQVFDVRRITPSLEEAYFTIVEGEDYESVAS